MPRSPNAEDMLNKNLILFGLGLVSIGMPGRAVAATPSVAHERSRFAVVDPVYGVTQVTPPLDFKEGPPWLYGDGELETWRLKVMRQRSEAVCVHVGYPGVFHEPSAHARFCLYLPAEQRWPQEVRLKAIGDVTVITNGTTVFHAKNQSQPHTIKLGIAPDATVNQLQIELTTTDGEPPGILISDGPCSTARPGWQWSAEGRQWGPVRAFPQTASGTPPHRTEQPVVNLWPVATQEAGLIDFGRTILARVSFRFDGTPVLVVGESAAEARETRLDIREQRTDLDRTPDGHWISRYPLAFRFLRIAGGTATDVKAEAIFHPAQYRGAFACSDQRLTRIWMQSAYTLRLCMNDLMVDGIKRDRLPWIGDQAMNVAVDAYTVADAEVLRRTFTALGRNGVGATDINGIVDYSLWWVINQDSFQRYFEDPAYLRLEWLRIKSLLDLMVSQCDKDGFLVPRRGTWLFIDWGTPQNPKLTNVSLQVLWYWALRSGAALADRSGDRRTATAWQERSAALEQMLQRRAWDVTARGWRLYVDKPGKLSRHANLLAVVSGLADQSQYADICRHLPESELPPAVTPFMTSLEILALSRAGAAEAIIPRVEKYWGPMLDRGASTFWESYNPAGSGSVYAMYNRPFGNSLCHAWASGPAALLPGEILGIRPLADGWKTFVVEPKLGRLTWAAATVPTTYGNIEVLADKKEMVLRIPAGTMAKWGARKFNGPTEIKEKM
jgi:alpha-L-rhamnosidase